jgi:hypothetical protein
MFVVQCPQEKGGEDMPSNEREQRTLQEDRLFDLLEAHAAEGHERKKILERQIARAESGMTVEEIAHVKERVARVARAVREAGEE